MLNLDNVLVDIGEFGPYQIFVYFLLCFATIPGAFHVNVGVFLTPKLDYRCAIDGLKNDTYAVQGSWHEYLVNKSIPQEYDVNNCSLVYSHCHRYSQQGNEVNCEKWVFDKSIYKKTGVEEFDLVCGLKDWRTYSLMAPMVGMLVGSVVFGTLSDYFGRKRIFLLCNLLQTLAGIACAFAPNLPYFVLYRFLEVSFCMGQYLTIFVLCMEIVGPSKRMWAGVIINFFWAAAVEMLAGIGYALRDWHHLQLAISVPTVIFLTYYWLVPESPRWLISKGRKVEAMGIVEKIAKYNKTIVPSRFYHRESKEEKRNDDLVDKNETGVRLWLLCGSPKMAIRSLIILLNWIAVTLAYYGLLLFAGSVSTDVYKDFALSGVVEFPGYVIALLLLNRIGRRYLHSSSMILGGLACVCSVFPVIFAARDPCEKGLDVITLVLSLIGRLGASAGFAVIYIFSSELFPTKMRNAAMGFCSMSARIGGIASPYIATLDVGGKLGTAFPLLIFGGMSLAAGLLSLLLPETLNRTLPDTIADAENFPREAETKNIVRVSRISNIIAETDLSVNDKDNNGVAPIQ